MLKGSLYNAAVVDYEKDGGAISGVDNEEVCWANGAALNKTLASLKEGDIFVVPANRTFYLMGALSGEDYLVLCCTLMGTWCIASRFVHGLVTAAVPS